MQALQNIYTTYEVSPQAIVGLELGTAVDIPLEQLDGSFAAAANGIQAKMLSSKADRTQPVSARMEIDANGIVHVTGNGVNSMTVGVINDLYNTILSNEEVWKANHESPEDYLRSIMPYASIPLSEELATNIDSLVKIKDPTTVLEAVQGNLSNFTGSEESVDRVASVLLDNAKIARAAHLPEVAKQLKALEDELWTEFMADEEPTSTPEPATPSLEEEIQGFVTSMLDVLTEEEIDTKLRTAGFSFKNGTVARL